MFKKILIESNFDPMQRTKGINYCDFWKEAFMDNSINDIGYYNFNEQIDKKKLYVNKISYSYFQKKPIDIYKRAEASFLKHIDGKDYDLIVFLKGEFVRKELILKIRKAIRNVKIINIFADNPFFYFDVYKAIPYYDHFFIKDSYILKELQKSGYNNCHYLPQACSSEHHRFFGDDEMTKEEKQKYSSDISFIGSIYPQRQKIIENLKGFDLKIWGKSIWDSVDQDSWILKRHQHELAILDKKCKIISSSKININTHHYQNDIFGCNKRVFEICGCGGFQIVDMKEDLRKVFTPGREIVTFETGGEMREKVEYYLKNPDERDKIARRGYKRAHKEHTYSRRAKEILRIISG